MDVSNENYLKQLSETELQSLEKYLSTLNSNVVWKKIIDKNFETTNEKFMKEIRKNISDNVRKCNNIYDNIIFLYQHFDFSEKIYILKPNLSNITNIFLIEYYKEIIEEYENFFNFFNYDYEWIDEERKNCLLLGDLTKKINYDHSMILNNIFPLDYYLSKKYNILIFLIFLNINSFFLDFDISYYNFLSL